MRIAGIQAPVLKLLCPVSNGVSVMNVNDLRKSVMWILATATLALTASCGANETILRSGKDVRPPINSDPVASSIEKDIDDMQTADFAIVLVLRRRDGSQIDADDRSVIRQQTDQVNRRVSSDSGRAVVIGSNFPLLPEKYAELRDRFDIENFSKPYAVISATPIK